MALHAPQVHGFFSVPTDHLQAEPVICGYLAQGDLSNAVALFDLGQAKRAAGYAERLSLPVAVIEKERISDSEVRLRHLMGDLEGKDVIIFDDEISRGTSLMATVAAIEDRGVRSVRAASTHGLFCGPALAAIEESPLAEVVTTNTVYLAPERRLDRITILSVAPLFAEAIKRIHTGESVSRIFR